MYIISSVYNVDMKKKHVKPKRKINMLPNVDISKFEMISREFRVCYWL